MVKNLKEAGYKEQILTCKEKKSGLQHIYLQLISKNYKK